MSSSSGLLRRAHSLADPLRSFTWMLIALAVLLPIVNHRHLWTTVAVVSSLLAALALLVASHGRANAIYLRSPATGRSTIALRLRLAAILGPRFRLAAFCPPQAKPGFFRRFLLPYAHAKFYAGSRLTELQGGEDWLPRLAKTLEKSRLVFLDARDTAPIAIAIQLALTSVGLERAIFLVDGSRPLDDWRKTLAAIAGPAANPEKFQLLPVDSPELKAQLKALAKALPRGVAGAVESAGQFALDHASEEQVGRSRGVSPFSLVGWLIALLIVILFPLLWGPVAAFLAPIASVAAIAIPLAILAIPLLRSLARDGRLLVNGHWFYALLGLVTAAVAVYIAIAPQVLTSKTVEHPSGAPARLFSPASTARADAVAGDMQTIYDAEMAYSNVHFAKGFTCSLAELATDSASAQILDRNAGDPRSDHRLRAELPSGHHAGYAFAMASCPAMKVNGRQMFESIQVTATPESGKGKGFCLVVTPERRYLKADPRGGTSCTERLKLRF